MLDTIKRMAVTIATGDNGPIRPLSVDGNDYYVTLLHPAQAKTIQATTQGTQAQREAMPRGSDNPIFTGALGVWNGQVLHAWNHLPTSAANEKHAVLCGAQAGLIAFGQAFSVLDGVSRSANQDNGFPFYWAEEIEDYGNEIGIAGSTIFGMVKSRFNSEDFGTIALKTTDTI